MTVIGIVPARGGSRRIEGKNATQCAGLPLMAWTCYAALHAARIDRVIVSTDDESIEAIARRCGGRVEVVPDPIIPAPDTSRLDDVIAHVLATYGGEWTRAVLLQPTSPLRTAKHIDEAMALLLGDPGLDTVVGVYRDPGSEFVWAPARSGRTIVPLFAARPRTQDITNLRENGSIYAFTRKSWESHRVIPGYAMDRCVECGEWCDNDRPCGKPNRLGGTCAPLIMSGSESVDVDDYDSLRVAEYWLQAQLFRRNDEFRRYLDLWCGEKKEG